VALDPDGKPSFNLLQNYAAGADLHFFIFDVLVLKGNDVMGDPLVKRRELLEKHVFPRMSEPIRYSPVLEASLKDLIQSVKAQGLEGLVAKRRESKYEPGLRSGAWQKMRVNQRQEFVIGGYTVGGATFDALVFGYYDGGNLIYAARTRNGFTPKLRAELLKKFKPLEIKTCPFSNLPEKKAGRFFGLDHANPRRMAPAITDPMKPCHARPLVKASLNVLGSRRMPPIDRRRSRIRPDQRPAKATSCVDF
jgi:bifunctional non-homologous end joining protein LigD